MTPQVPLRVIVAAVFCALVWSGWLGLRHLDGRATLFDPMEAVFVDFRNQLVAPPIPSGEVVIVAIDDATVSRAGGYPIDRADLTKLVAAIRNAQARTLAIDLLFVDKGKDLADRLLANELSQLPTIIAAAGLFGQKEQGTTAIPILQDLLEPLPVLSGAAKVGLVNVATGNGGTPRHVPLVFRTKAGPAPSFALQAASQFLGATLPLSRDGVRIEDKVHPLDIGFHMPIRYYGPRGTIPTISATQVLNGVSQLRGKLVVLGATASGIGDRFETPYDAVLPGVEVQATAIANLLERTLLHRGAAQRRIDVVAMIGLAIAAVVLVSYAPLTLATMTYSALLLGWLGLACVFYGQGIWFSMILPLTGSLPVAVGLILVRQVYDHQTARRQAIARRELSRFQSPEIAGRIADDPSFLLHPQTQDAAILFVDLTGFTGSSERMGPEKTRDMLKSFHTLIVEIANNHGGLVLDFMGDGAMIGFGIPDAHSGAAGDALCTGFSLVKAVRHWVAQAGSGEGIEDVRIGAHCGTVVLSRLGHERQQQITVTGDCVNVASRLMEVGKSFNASITVSAQMLDRLSLASLGLPDPDMKETVAIRGRDQKLAIALWQAGRRF